MPRLARTFFSLGAALAFQAAAQDLPVEDGRWDLTGPDIRLETLEGRSAIVADSGFAYRRDVRLEDGTIEFDVRLARRRSFVYLMFRMEDDGEHEEIYLRPHKSGLPDAMQYAPVYQGQSAWQLHHGPGATAAVEFEPGAWTHVRLVVQGRRAALFVGEQEKPALVVPRLARAPRAGYLGLRAFVPPGTPGGEPAARFANVRSLPGVAAHDFSSLPAAAAPVAGAIREWAVSQAFTYEPTTPPRRPDDAVVGRYQRIEADPSGLLELHRHVRVPGGRPGPRVAGRRETTAAARVHIRAAKEGVYALDLGFSDQAIVFLDGRAIFRGEGSYSFDNPRREGLIGYDQATLYLPLRAGDNELLVVVRDSFGGMGLMARFVDSVGLAVEAR